MSNGAKNLIYRIEKCLESALDLLMSTFDIVSNYIVMQSCNDSFTKVNIFKNSIDLNI